MKHASAHPVITISICLLASLALRAPPLFNNAATAQSPAATVSAQIAVHSAKTPGDAVLRGPDARAGRPEKRRPVPICVAPGHRLTASAGRRSDTEQKSSELNATMQEMTSEPIHFIKGGTGNGAIWLNGEWICLLDCQSVDIPFVLGQALDIRVWPDE